jgi:hypothetical protein
MSRRNLYLSLLFGSLLLLGILLGFLWTRAGPIVAPSLTKLPEVEIVPPVPQSTASAYRLSAPFPEVKNLPIYEYSFPDGTPKERAVRWARVLGFAGEPEEGQGRLLGETFSFSKGGEYLEVRSKASSLSYSVDIAADESVLKGSFLPSPEQAAVIVERTIRDLGFYSPRLQFDPQKTRFLKKGTSRPRPSAQSEADFLEIHYTAKIGDRQIYLDSGQSLIDPIIAWVGKDGRLLYLEYHVVGRVGGKRGDYPLKSREEVLADLKEGRGVIVDSSFLGKPDISSLTINQISLGYLLPLPDVNIIQPIYVLRGTGVLASGERITLTYYLPAVKNR